jgi:hypothetical protein
MTVAGCVTAAAKGVITNLFMVGSLKLHPMDLLTYTSTLSAIQLLAVVAYNGELQEALGVRGTSHVALAQHPRTGHSRTHPHGACLHWFDFASVKTLGRATRLCLFVCLLIGLLTVKGTTLAKKTHLECSNVTGFTRPTKQTNKRQTCANLAFVPLCRGPQPV